MHKNAWISAGILTVALLGFGADCGSDDSGGGSQAGSGGGAGSSQAGSGGSAQAGSGGSSQAGAGGSAGTTQSEGEPPGMSGMVAAHNKARAAVSPAADPALPPMAWDDQVAAQAQKWADGCNFEHNPALGSLGLGENLYADSGGAAPAEVVKSWADEGADYSYDSDSCADGKECGHYTQVVWRASVKVGCAKKSCTANSPFGADFPSWDLWVCDYSPAGNSGSKPY